MAGPIGDYSLAVAAAKANRFAPPAEDDSLRSTYGYAYQFDATLFAPWLRDFALPLGVTRVEGLVTEVLRDGESGDVTALKLADGREVASDIFVHCSGFRSLMPGQALRSDERRAGKECVMRFRSRWSP